MPSPIVLDIKMPQPVAVAISTPTALAVSIPGYAVMQIPSNYGLITWDGSVLTVS